MRMEDVPSEGLGPADALQASATLNLADPPALLAQALARQRALLRENQQLEVARQQVAARWLAAEAVAGIGSYELDLASGAMHFSEGLYRLFGEVPHSFVPSVAWIDARTDPADAAAAQRVLAQAQVDKQPYHYTRRVRRADGQWRTFALHGRVVCDATGAASRLEGVVEDKTEQYQAEQALRASRELLQATLDSSPDRVQVLEAVRDEQGKLVDFTWRLTNRVAEQAYGDVIGRRLLAHDPGVVERGMFDVLKQVVETGQPDRRERPYTSGQFEGWVYQSTVKLHDGVVTTTADISERKRSEQEVLRLKDELAQRADDKYRTLFNAIDEDFCLLELLYDAQGTATDYRVLEVNQVLERQTGLASVPGKLSRDLPPDAEPHWLATYAQVVQTGQPVRFEHYHADTGRWYEAYASRIGGGGSRQVCAVFSDVTEHKHQQLLLQLSDVLRPLADAGAIQAAATHTARLFFGADRCYYGEIGGGRCLIRRDAAAAGLPSVAGRYDLATIPLFGAGRGASQPLAVEDVRTTEPMDDALRQWCGQLAVVSYISVPLVKHGEAVGVLCVGQGTPRRWAPQEVALIAELAERTWAAVERAKMEESLRESEQKFRTLADTAPALIWCNNERGENQFVNQYFLDFIGYSEERVRNLAWHALIHPEDAPAYLASYEAAVQQRRAWQSRNRLRRFDGTWHWFDNYAQPLTSQDGRFLGHVGVSTNVTDIVRAADALRESERQLRSFVTASSDSLYRMAADWQQLHSLQGKDFMVPTEAPNRTWLTQYIPPADQPVVWAAVQAAIAERRFLELEHRVFRADGSVGWAFSRAVPVLGPQGELLEWFGTATDITARKQAEEALRQSEERLRMTVDAASLGTWDWNLATNEVRWNNQHFAQLGLQPRPGPLLPDHFARHVHPHERAEVLRRLRLAVDENRRFEAEFRVVTAQDELRWMRGHGQATEVDPSGRVRRMSGVMLDVTTQKHAEQHLQALAASLERKVQRRTAALQQSRDLLQSVYDTTLIGMAVLRAVRNADGDIEDFVFRSVNHKLQEETGRTDLVGQYYTDVFPGVGSSGLLALMRRAVETGEPQKIEYYYPYEGFAQWYSSMYVKLDDGVVATIRNVTERKHAEQELRKNLQLLEQSEEVAELGSWMHELATGELRWSVGMYRLFQLAPGTPVQPTIYRDYVVAADRPAAERVVRALTTAPAELEETLRLQVGGEERTVRLKAVLVRDEAGQPTHLLGVDLDISRVQRLEADNLRLRLRQQQALFAAVQEAQEEERRRISESLHNGLGQLLYATKLQLDRLPAAPNQAASREAGRLLGEAIRQTRALSHELTPAILEEFGLEATLQSTCRTLNASGLHWHCHFVFEGAPPLPLPLQLAVYRLAQELSQNVLKHAQATEATMEVEVLAAWVVLRVEDNGRGFDPARTSDGLGLRTLRSRVALLGGSVHLATGPGQGTQCQVRLPLITN